MGLRNPQLFYEDLICYYFVKNTLYKHCHVSIQSRWIQALSVLAQCAGAVTLYNAYRISGLEDQWREWFVFLRETWESSFFSQGRKYYCVKLVYWGCCSLFPVFASKSHLWKKQNCKLKLARGQICYQALWGCASAFILDKFRGRKRVQDWSWPL